MKQLHASWGAACLGLLGLLEACTTAPSDPSSARLQHVGLQRLSLTDPERLNWASDAPRPLNTMIWYPARRSAEMEPITIPPDAPLFIGGEAAPGARINRETRHPVVMLSHGTGGSAFQMMWLGRALAEHGYIAIAVDHHGNTAVEPDLDPRSFAYWWERARDISALLDILETDAVWSDRMDWTNISAAGFSIGGYTTAILAGARTDRDQFFAFCASDQRDGTCEPQLEYPTAQQEFQDIAETDPSLIEKLNDDALDWSDARIQKFVLIAPAPGMALTDDSLSAINHPGLIIGGASDKVAPIASNAGRIASLWENADLQTLQDVTHYDFLNSCTERGIEFTPVCQGGSYNKTAAHNAAIALTLAFLGGE
ncbi:MAG: hypothetical protein CMK09_18245 [Ponticaulis sp.]|nr:hypothetical protein [Ponticaulis sp.]|tara:strand:+ start:10350 stop:11456 length:1107 start_codon:yes stop_codon:yes gene_type:complete